MRIGLLFFLSLLLGAAVSPSTAQTERNGSLLLRETGWRYVTDYPKADWAERRFDDRRWTSGMAAFGSGSNQGLEARTKWSSGQLWLRKTFELRDIPKVLQLRLHHRADVQVYINGKLAADVSGNTTRGVPIPVTGTAQSGLRKGKNVLAVHATAIGDDPWIDLTLEEAFNPGNIPAPLFRDPRFDGAADPSVIWDPVRRLWRMFYTQRRANLKELPGVGYCFGSDIGMAVSHDGGRTWSYDGEALGLEFQGGRNTFWAPEVFFAKGEFHMLVTYIQGVFTHWGGNPVLVHYTSRDLRQWHYEGKLPLNGVIDGCVVPLPDGGWRLYFKRDSKTFMADSPDLANWNESGVATDDEPQEGPQVFRWKDHYWMIADVWHGQAVYQSDDLRQWKRQPGTLLGLPPGNRRDDAAFGRHADVVVQGDRAFIVYFTHPGGDTDHERATSLKRTSIQVAELEYRDGKMVCDRDKPLDYSWKPELVDW